ncbi:corrinoid protein [Thermodesulfobacteriota bacterium]
MPNPETIRNLEQSVIDGDTDRAENLARQVLKEKIDIQMAIDEGLIKGIKQVGDAFGNGEAFLPDLIMSGEAMKIASDILEEELQKSGAEIKSAGGKLVIGTVAGDIHDIGKTLVATLFKGAGFQVIDLGVDVPREKFIEAVNENKPDIIGLSSLLTSSAGEQKLIMEALQDAGLRSEVKVMVGGGAISEKWAHDIGADAYGGDAWEAVEAGSKLMDV